MKEWVKTDKIQPDIGSLIVIYDAKNSEIKIVHVVAHLPLWGTPDFLAKFPFWKYLFHNTKENK